MKRSALYVTRQDRQPRRTLPPWLYEIRYRLALRIVPPHLIAYIPLHCAEEMANVCIDDGQTGRPLFEAEVIYLRRPSDCQPNDQTI